MFILLPFDQHRALASPSNDQPATPTRRAFRAVWLSFQPD
jgi:hypothetical protein